MEGFSNDMPRVEFLLFRVDSRYNHPQKLLNMLHSNKMRRGLRFLKKEDKRDITPFLILQQYFPKRQQQPPLPLNRPIILSSITNENMF